MNEEKYNKVLAALPFWKPSRQVPMFGIAAIQSIVECDSREALEIRNRMAYEGAIPKDRW
ncbi:hypothetical protein B0H99_101401 [Planomicrobium soli]|uniref:Uncharacterized protein n=1 Tax=Planomicrobium soli TaxID=1176648 RepID=A0A2P8H7F7_9BACL|nr:hypothetical protein [Planomicrobium soli]PSL42153.1 hypothetical protein B0H99_101401 [Planomicrobium soli]